MRKRESKYRDTDKGKLTRKVSHIRERFKDATTDEIRDELNKFIGKPCRYCKVKLTIDNCSADHAISLANGGNSDKNNLDIICKSCNSAKSDMNWDLFAALIRVARDYEEEDSFISRLKKASLIYTRR